MPLGTFPTLGLCTSDCRLGRTSAELDVTAVAKAFLAIEHGGYGNDPMQFVDHGGDNSSMSDTPQKNGADQQNQDQQQEMRIDPQRATHLASNLAHIHQRIRSASPGRSVRLIAVSKLKPAQDILALHQPPQNNNDHEPHYDFGENYAQELTEKSRLLPRSIRWHMIGGLQTNKCKPLAEQVANLYCVSSVDTAKKADALEKGRAALVEREGEGEHAQLRVLVQVNTSGEDNKSGVEPADTATLCQHIREKCPRLQLAGLMTIGAIARSQAAESPEAVNEDFVRLREVRDQVVQELGLKQEELELSMGMSSDFEAAIRQGSDEVRVGTTIFGERPAKKDAVVS